MKIVADENVDRQIVDRLRANGHEVLRRRRSHGGGIEPRFDEYLSAIAKGKDTTKVRIVLE